MLKKIMNVAVPAVLAFILTGPATANPAQDQGLSGGQEIGIYCVDFGYLVHQIYVGRQLGMSRMDTMKHVSKLMATRPTPPRAALYARLEQALKEAYSYERELTEYDVGVGAFAFGSYYENECLDGFKGF